MAFSAVILKFSPFLTQYKHRGRGRRGGRAPRRVRAAGPGVPMLAGPFGCHPALGQHNSSRPSQDKFSKQTRLPSPRSRAAMREKGRPPGAPAHPPPARPGAPRGRAPPAGAVRPPGPHRPQITPQTPPSPSEPAPRLCPPRGRAERSTHRSHGRNFRWGCSYAGHPTGVPPSLRGSREGQNEVTWRCQEHLPPPGCLRRFDFHHLLPCGMRSGETKKMRSRRNTHRNCSGSGELGVHAPKPSPTCLF